MLAGLQRELDEDYLVALELGVEDPSALSDVQKQYLGKLKQRLSQVGLSLPCLSSWSPPDCFMSSVLYALSSSFPCLFSELKS